MSFNSSKKDELTKKVLPQIYLDMDETIVDWFSGANAALSENGYPNWTNEYWLKYSVDEAERIKWSILNSKKDFWECLSFTKHGLLIWDFIKPYKPKILTAYNSYSEPCKIGKIYWISQNLGIRNISGVHIVQRSEKKDFAKNVNNNPNILIDDYHKNCLEYEQAGGIAIQTTTSEEVIKKLKQFGF